MSQKIGDHSPFPLIPTESGKPPEQPDTELLSEYEVIESASSLHEEQMIWESKQTFLRRFSQYPPLIQALNHLSLSLQINQYRSITSPFQDLEQQHVLLNFFYFFANGDEETTNSFLQFLCNFLEPLKKTILKQFFMINPSLIVEFKKEFPVSLFISGSSSKFSIHLTGYVEKDIYIYDYDWTLFYQLSSISPKWILINSHFSYEIEDGEIR